MVDSPANGADMDFPNWRGITGRNSRIPLVRPNCQSFGIEPI